MTTETPITAAEALQGIATAQPAEVAALLAAYNLTPADLDGAAWQEVSIGGGCTVLEAAVGDCLLMLTDGEGFGTPLEGDAMLTACPADDEERMATHSAQMGDFYGA